MNLIDLLYSYKALTLLLGITFRPMVLATSIGIYSGNVAHTKPVESLI